MMERKIDRFYKYMDFKRLNPNIVTKDLGLATGTIGKSRKIGRDLSAKNVEKVLNFYADLNRIWFLTGEGEMINENKKGVIINSGGHTQYGNNNKIEENYKKEIEYLKEQVDMFKKQLEDKNEIIKLLKSKK